MSSKSKNNIWRNALQEQTLCEDMEKFNSLANEDDEKVIKVERGVESFKYSLDQFEAKENQQKKNHLACDDKKEEARERDDAKERIGESVYFDPLKSRSHILASESDSETSVVKEILKQLKETNSDIISKR